MNTNKLLPAFVSDLLTLNGISNYIAVASDVSSALPTGIEITNIEIVCEVLTLEASSMAELLRHYPRLIRLKSSSYLYGSSQLNAGDLGIKDITYAHSLNSLTEFIWWSSPADSSDKTYGGVNPNLGTGGYQLIINATPYPTQPVKCDRLAECMYQIKKAWGSLYSTDNTGTIKRVAGTASGEYKTYTCGALTVAQIADVAKSKKWYACIDFELINNFKDSLYSGINIKDGTHTFRVNVDRALPGVTSSISYYSHFEVVLEFDYINRAVSMIQ